MKAIVFSKRAWRTLWDRIVAEHGNAIRISWVCKERLGFTVREHMVYGDVDSWEDRTEIHLDFYDEQMRTLFLLKYYDKS